MYGISLFCLCSENRDFLHSKILCFCIFFVEIGVLNTNRTPEVAESPQADICPREFVRSKARSTTNHLAVHAELTQFLFRLLFGQEVDAVDTLFFGRLHIHQRIIQENALICL